MVIARNLTKDLKRFNRALLWIDRDEHDPSLVGRKTIVPIVARMMRAPVDTGLPCLEVGAAAAGAV
jgi:hypothetical protein